MNAPIEDQLRDYFQMVDRMQGPIDPTTQSQDTPTLRLVTENIHDTNESTMEVIMISPDRNEPHNRSRTWMLVAACVAAVALVGGLIVAANRDSDEASVNQPTVTVVEQAAEPTVTVVEQAAEPTTTAAESTLAPSSGTVEVPFYVIDANVPGDANCGSFPSFNVSFSDENGGSTVVEARIEHNSLADEVVNATCTRGVFHGLPALFWAAALEAPAGDTYESIELRYPLANGRGIPGRDGNITVFEMVTQAEAEAGLYVEVNGSSSVPLDPSDVENFPLAD